MRIAIACIRNAALLLLAVPAVANACGSTEEWYFENVQVVFDGEAKCNQDKRYCWVRIYKMRSNEQGFALGKDKIKVDFHNWYGDNPVPDGAIEMRCGYPLFEPERSKFKARFFADVDRKTGELKVRKLSYLDGKTR